MLHDHTLDLNQGLGSNKISICLEFVSENILMLWFYPGSVVFKNIGLVSVQRFSLDFKTLQQEMLASLLRTRCEVQFKVR